MMAMMSKTSVQVGLLIAATLLVYTASLQNGWVWLDDVNYIQQNELVTEFSAARLPELFTSVRGNFTPLTWPTHIAAYRLFGAQAFGHHLVSLILHLCNILLVYSLTRRLCAVGLTGAENPQYPLLPFIAALIFALHPQNVEAVAWIAARKDLVMCLFALLSAISWIEFCERPGALRYAAALGLFVLACLAKPTAAMLVVPFFVLALWIAQALGRSACLSCTTVRMLPMVVVAAAMVWFAWAAQVSAGAVAPESSFSGADRAVVVRKNVWGYSARSMLAGSYYVNYPLVKGFNWQAAAGLALLAALAAALASKRYRRPAVLTGVALVLLLPGLGVAQYGVQAAGDRFAYLAGIPFAICVTWVACAGYARLRKPAVKSAVAVLLTAGLLVVGGRSFLQAAVWRSDLSLWAHAVTVAPGNPLAWQYLGYAFLRRGDYSRALEGFSGSLERIGNGVYIDVRSLYFGLGVSSYETGRQQESAQWFARLQEEGLDGFDRAAYAWYYLALLAEDVGDRANAIAFVERSIELMPGYEAALELLESLR